MSTRKIRRPVSASAFACATAGAKSFAYFTSVSFENSVGPLWKQPATYQFAPDYIGFLGFAYAALDCVGTNYPDAERVDFLIERKTTITHNIGGFLASLEGALHHKGRPELVRLIGELIPGGKDRVPNQAADVAVWHLRRDACKNSDVQDAKRLGWMFDRRPMMLNGMTLEEISTMGGRSKANAVPSPFPPKPKRSDRAT